MTHGTAEASIRCATGQYVADQWERATAADRPTDWRQPVELNRKQDMASEQSEGMDTFRQMALRMAWTVCASLPVPVALLFFLAQFRSLGPEHGLGSAISAGLAEALGMVSVAIILTRAFAAGGLAVECFRWPAEICRAFRATAWTLLTAVAPLLGVTAFFRTWEQGAHADSMGRLSLMVAMFLLGQTMWDTGNAIVAWEAGRPRGGRTVLFAGGRLFRLIAVGLPMSLVLLAAIGYRYAAEQLGTRLVWMWLAGSAVTLLTGLAVRLMELHRNRLASRLTDPGAATRQQLSELNDHAGQVLKLLRAATVTAMAVLIFQLWADVIPLGAALDRFRMWPQATAVAGSTAGAATAEFVTLRHLLLACGIFALTMIASRNLPGLIQLLMPGSLPLDKGGRYAVTFVARYLVGLIGLVQAAMWMGFQWDRVQWLVAGLTVGLGFGLQEVFANLVSGLIILMERPVRVGDLVSVNNVSGTVTRMALRATTIQDADRREWIVPNKKFITDDVMNWTLSDSVSRAVFPVSVAHGSDTLQVREILLTAARCNPLILEYPEPSVLMSRIGGTSLDFELRVFLASRSVFTQVQNELLFRIERELRAAGIETAANLSDQTGQVVPPPRRRRRNRNKPAHQPRSEAFASSRQTAGMRESLAGNGGSAPRSDAAIGTGMYMHSGPGSEPLAVRELPVPARAEQPAVSSFDAEAAKHRSLASEAVRMNRLAAGLNPDESEESTESADQTANRPRTGRLPRIIRIDEELELPNLTPAATAASSALPDVEFVQRRAG